MPGDGPYHVGNNLQATGCAPKPAVGFQKPGGRVKSAGGQGIERCLLTESWYCKFEMQARVFRRLYLPCDKQKLICWVNTICVDFLLIHTFSCGLWKDVCCLQNVQCSTIHNALIDLMKVGTWTYFGHTYKMGFLITYNLCVIRKNIIQKTTKNQK